KAGIKPSCHNNPNPSVADMQEGAPAKKMSRSGVPKPEPDQRRGEAHHDVHRQGRHWEKKW
ncbi:Hypothetical protein FKW44_005134, partial [Caligus rogercresseyi]